MTQVNVTAIENGIRVVTSSLPHVESVTAGFWVGIGSRYETPEVAGVSHFIEHLLFKGTKNRTARVLSQEIEGRGGYLNAFTQEESTCYYARVAFDQLSRAADVLVDMYRNPLFAEAEIEKERGVIIEEMMMYEDQPQHVVQELLGQSVWKGHPLGRPVIGNPDSIRTMSRRNILDYMSAHYVPGVTVAAFAGRVDHAQCVDLVRRLMDGVRKGSVPRCRRVGETLRQDRAAFRFRDIEQVHLAMGFRTFGRHDERRYAMRVMNVILGENMSSRLFQTVREKHGLAYSVHSMAHSFSDSGAMVISAGLDRKRYFKALQLIVRELARLRERPVGVSELRRAKDYVIGQMRLGMESTTNQMMWIGDNLISYGRFISPDEVIRKIEAVNAADVTRVACDSFQSGCCTMAVVSPELPQADRDRVHEIAGVLPE